MKIQYTTTDQEFIEVVKTSSSIRQSLQKLKLKPTGGNYETAKRRIKKLNLDTSHFTGKAWNKGKAFSRQKRSLEFYLQNNCPKIIKSNQLRVRLIKEGFKQHVCEACSRSEWNGKPIPLELHHRDGNNKNNELSNLELLCPNCHSQTETYGVKNIKRLTAPQFA